MTGNTKRVFATLYVSLIQAGRRKIDDVPTALVDVVKVDLEHQKW